MRRGCGPSRTYHVIESRFCAIAFQLKRWLSAAVAIGFLTTAAPSADIHVDVVVLQPDNLGDDRAFITKFIRKYDRTWPYEAGQEIAPYDRRLIAKALRDVYVARYDLTGDGRPELIVGLFSLPFCGTAGCTGFVFEKHAGKWKLLVSTSLDEGSALISQDETRSPKLGVLFLAHTDFPAMRAEYVAGKTNWHHITVPAVVDGHKTFFNHTDGYYWDGKEYQIFCLDRCGYEDG